jgi:hypothetical protein
VAGESVRESSSPHRLSRTPKVKMNLEESEKTGRFTPKEESTEFGHKHAHQQSQKQKARREKRFEDKRRRKEEPKRVDGLREMIAGFPKQQFVELAEPKDIMNTLLKLLQGDGAEPYYRKSPLLYPEHVDGPFLFDDMRVMQKFSEILKQSQDVDLLRQTTHCLIIISAHPETMVWGQVLENAGVLPALTTLAEKCPDRVVYENCVWALANIAMDSRQCRDLILKNTNQLSFITESKFKENVDVCCFFFKSCLKDDPRPPVALLWSLWKLVVAQLLTRDISPQSFSDVLLGIVHATHAEEDGCGDQYRTVIVENTQLLKFFMRPDRDLKPEHFILIADIIGTLLWSEHLHQTLLKNDIVKLMGLFIQHRDPRIREEGAMGLAILSSNAKAVSIMLEDETLCDILVRQINRTDIMRIKENIITTLGLLIVVGSTSLEQRRNICQKAMDNNWIREFVFFIHRTETATTTLSIIITAIRNMAKHNMNETTIQLQDSDAITRLETLATSHPHDDIRHLCKILCDLFDQVSERMDMEDD